MLDRLPLAFALIIGLPSSVQALVVGDPAGNTNNTTPDPAFPFNNTGYINNGAAGSATYLGGGLVITAQHNIGLTNDVVLNGTTYAWDSSINGGTGYFNVDPANGLDLAIIKIDGANSLPGLSLYCEDVVSGLDITVTGTGFQGLYNDNGTGNPGDDYFTWLGTRPSPPATYWGTNKVELVGIDNNGNHLFTTNFDRIGTPGSTSDESSGASGDSGGGAYVLNGTNWELAGIIFAAAGGADPDVPVDEHYRSAYGYQTVFVDLPQYKDEIIAIAASIESPVPEPSAAMLALLAFAALGFKRGRQ